MTTKPTKPRKRKPQTAAQKAARRQRYAAPADLSAVDPRDVLRSIAGNPAMPPTARVAAAKGLLFVDKPTKPSAAEQPEFDKSKVPNSKLTARALLMMNVGSTKGN